MKQIFLLILSLAYSLFTHADDAKTFYVYVQCNDVITITPRNDFHGDILNGIIGESYKLTTSSGGNDLSGIKCTITKHPTEYILETIENGWNVRKKKDGFYHTYKFETLKCMEYILLSNIGLSSMKSFNTTYVGGIHYWYHIIIVNVTSISIDKKINLFVGDTHKFKPTTFPSDTHISKSWKSSNKKVVSVDGNGKVTAKSVGSAVITCTTSNGLTTQCTVTVRKPVNSIKLNTSNKTIFTGKTYQLKATVSPSDATVKDVKWSSNNSKVATVNSSGLVKAVGKGSATITCTAKDGSKVSSKCAITVKDIMVTSVTLNAKSKTLYTSKKFQLKATVSPSDATNKKVKWSSSNTNVATVSSAGLVKAIAKGTATITCTAIDGSKKCAKCNITVKNKLVTDISLNAENMTLYTGKDFLLVATVNPTDATNKNVVWKSSNSKIASVNSFGYVKAIGKGSATITCSAADGSNVKAICKIMVKNKTKASAVRKQEKSVYMLCGEFHQFDTSDFDGAINWFSNDENVANVDDEGRISAFNAGTCEIVGIDEFGNTVASCKVIVSAPSEIADAPTFIQRLETLRGDENIYDLRGKRVRLEDAKRGIFIVNGKKIFLK